MVQKKYIWSAEKKLNMVLININYGADKHNFKGQIEPLNISTIFLQINKYWKWCIFLHAVVVLLVVVVDVVVTCKTQVVIINDLIETDTTKCKGRHNLTQSHFQGRLSK